MTTAIIDWYRYGARFYSTEESKQATDKKLTHIERKLGTDVTVIQKTEKRSDRQVGDDHMYLSNRLFLTLAV